MVNLFFVSLRLLGQWGLGLYMNSGEIMKSALIPIFKSVKCVHDDRPPAVIHSATLYPNNQYL